MTRLNTNIQVSAGLDTTQYVAGAKVVADTNQKIADSTKAATAAIIKDLEAALRKAEAALRKAEEAAKKSTSSFATLGKNASDSFLGALTGGLLGAGIAGAIAGIASVAGTAITGVIADIKDLGDTAAAVGLQAEELYTFQEVFREMGVSATEVNGIFDSLVKNIRRDADEFKQLGIAVKDADGNTRNIKDIIYDLSDAMLLMGDTTERATLAQKFFGSSWKDAVDVLDEGSSSLKANQEQYEEMGERLAEVSERADDFAEDLSRLTGELRKWAAAAVNLAVMAYDGWVLFFDLFKSDADKSADAMLQFEDKVAAAGRKIDADAKVRLAENKRAEEERTRIRERNAKEAESAAKALAAEQKRAAEAAQRQAEAYAKLRASGVDAIGDVNKELKEQSQAYADLITYGADYADTMASVRGAETERLSTLDKLNELLAKGALSQKEYNQAVEDGKTIRDSKVASSTTDALNAALQPLKEIQSITAGLDFAKGLFGDDALKALESYQLSVENSALALSIVNAELAAGVITESEYADAIKQTTDKLNAQTAANKERIDALQKDAQAQAQFVGDVKGAFDEFFDSLIDGSESGADAVKKLVAELLRAVAIAKLLELAGIGGGISIGGNSATPKAAIGSSAGLFSTRASGSPITIINNTGAPLQAQRQGDNSYKLTLGVVAAAIAQGNNPVARGIESQYGLRRTYGAY